MNEGTSAKPVPGTREDGVDLLRREMAEIEREQRIAVLQWDANNGIARMICNELVRMGHAPEVFLPEEPLPKKFDILFTFGPYGKILPIWKQAKTRQDDKEPVIVHWNTEGMPDLKLPLQLMRTLAAYRSKVGQLGNSERQMARSLAQSMPLKFIDGSMHRFRYLGDYEQAFREKLVDVLADTSYIYSRLRTKAGHETLYAPWGGTQDWYADLNLERDIDVLWIGKRGTSRRSRILDRMIEELTAEGVKVHIADNQQNPFIFEEERTEYFNRSKITLNITRTWFDDNFSRFAMAAPNRSLIVSEPVLPHCPEFVPGVHFVSAPVSMLSQQILYYLENEAERAEIVENCYQLTTTELSFRNSMLRMLQEAAKHKPGSRLPAA